MNFDVKAQLSWLEDAMKVTPGGGQTRSRTPGHVGPADTSADFPLFAEVAHGARIYPAFSVRSPNGLLDCFGANAAVPLGHACYAVTNAVTTAVNRGSLPSLASRQELRSTLCFLEMCAPWAQRVRWVKTGTEALMAAVRIARVHTGRDRVVVMDSSYHGWSDLNDARFTLQGQQNGVPLATAMLTSVMPYHSRDFAQYLGADIAAVIVEPHRWITTDKEWLQGLKAHCASAGIVFIMDEMVYGLRWAHGGASQYYGVEPDLACFGKALGGGVPVALVCGRADIMDHAAKYISGTYFGDVLGLAAAEAVLREYSEQPIIKALWHHGRMTWHGFADAYQGSAARLEGFHVHWRLVLDDMTLMDRVQVEAANNGVLFHKASNNASAAMTVNEAYECGEVIGRAVAKVLEEKS